MQVCGRMLVVADYYIHKEYIAQNLCENRSKPQLHCEGKCHLKKLLKKKEKEEQAPPLKSIKDKSEIIPFLTRGVKLVFDDSVQLFHSTEVSSPLSSFIRPVFHPPSV